MSYLLQGTFAEVLEMKIALILTSILLQQVYIFSIRYGQVLPIQNIFNSFKVEFQILLSLAISTLRIKT